MKFRIRKSVNQNTNYLEFNPLDGIIMSLFVTIIDNRVAVAALGVVIVYELNMGPSAKECRA